MERIYIYDRSDNLINDPSRTLDYATNLRYSSRAPKGFYTCSFQCKRDIAETWNVKSAYKIIIRDGQRIVWQGYIQAINLSTRGYTVRVDCIGPVSILAQRVVRKRWIDNAPFDRFVWPADRLNNSSQQQFNMTRQGNLLRMKFPGQAYAAGNGEAFHWEYSTVTGGNIEKVQFDYYIEAGASDTILIDTYNTDQAASEDQTPSASNSTTDSDTNFVVTFSQGDTETFEVIIELDATDGDADGIVWISNYKVWQEYDYTAGVGNSYADEIIKDVLYIVDNTEGDLSTDYANVSSPAYALAAFATKGDTFESADTVIQRALSYGDGSANTWEFFIWDQSQSSDSKPQVTVRQRPATTDWEYAVSMTDLNLFNYESSLDELYNWIAVEYTAPDGESAFLWPDTQATLKDQTSIDTYGRRDKLINVGKSDSTTALANGVRYLTRHKDPLLKGQMTAIGQVRTKEGLPIPAGWVRAGERVKVLDFDGGTVFYLGEVEYNAETRELRMSPDLPPDNLAVLQAQQSLEIERPVL